MAGPLGLVANTQAAHAAAPGTTFAFTRVAGDTRFSTAAALATQAFPGGAPTVLIATGFNFPDALAGNYLAGQKNAPILLVNASGPVPQPTLDALKTLKTSSVIILGRENAVGTDVENQLKSTPSSSAAGGNITTSRLGGATRYDTMQLVDENPGAAAVGAPGGKKTALLARGDTFPDALGAGPVAFSQKFPVILTDPNTLSAQASQTIKDLGIQQIIVLGGTNAISSGVETSANGLGAATLYRANGSTRSDTSRLLGDFAITNFGFSNSQFTAASGDQGFGGADALASGPYAGLGTTGTGTAVAAGAKAAAAPVPQAVEVTDVVSNWGAGVAFCSEHKDTLAKATASGGPIPLPDSTLKQCSDLVNAKTSNQTITVTPTAPSIQQVSTASGTTNGERAARDYTVTVPSGISAVTIALFPCGNLTFNPDGSVTFADRNNNQQADANTPGSAITDLPGNIPAYIEKVNGTTVHTLPGAGNNVQANVTPVSGTVTFTVNSQVANTPICPVVFQDKVGNGQLTVDANGMPTEPYGVGGADLVVPAEAPFGATNGRVALAIPASHQFTTYVGGPGSTNTAPQLFNEKSTDQFNYSSGITGPSQVITQAQFDQFLSGLAAANAAGFASPGDLVTVNYNPSGTSIFNLTDDIPMPPTNVKATTTNTVGGSAQNDVQVTFTKSANPDIVAYDVFRAIVPSGNSGSQNALGTLAYCYVGSTTGTTFNDQGNGGTNSLPGGVTPPEGTNCAGPTGNPGLANATYSYVVLARNTAGETSPNSNFATAKVSSAATTKTPVSTATTFVNGTGQSTASNCASTNGCSNVVDKGDVITVAFINGPITAGPSASIDLRDTNGTVNRLTNGVNATFNTNSVGSLLTIAITGSPTVVAASSSGSQLNTSGAHNFAIENPTGITNANGAWNLAESGRQPGDLGPQQGLTAVCNTSPNATCDRSRVVDGSTSTTSPQNEFNNFDLVAPVDPAKVTVNTPNTVTIQPAEGHIQTGDTFQVFDKLGNQIAAGVYNNTAGTSVTTSAPFAAGDVLYLVYQNTPSANPAANGYDSITTVLNNPSPVPTVVAVTGSGNTYQVQWSSNVTQVGPPSNYTIYDSTNSTLLATGVTVTGSPCPQAQATPCLFTVTTDNTIPGGTGVALTLRVAANTVTNNNTNGLNTPNAAQVVPFTSSTIQGPAPTVTGISPSSGPAAGGTPATVSGTNFRPGATVTIDGNPAGITSVSPTAIQITTPAGTAGNVAPVVVTNTDGTSAGGATFTYTFPTPAFVSPRNIAPGSTLTLPLNQTGTATCPNTANAQNAFTITNNYTGAGAGPATGAHPTSIAGSGNSCVLTFATPFGSNDFGSIAYAQPASAADQVSINGQAAPGQTVTLNDSSAPAFASSSATASTITAVYNEPVLCSTATSSSYTVTVGGAPAGILSVGCTGTSNTNVTIVLTSAPSAGSPYVVTATNSAPTDPAGNRQVSGQTTSGTF